MQKAFAVKLVYLGAVLCVSAALAIAAHAQTQGGMMHHGGMMDSTQGQPDGTQGGVMGGMMHHGGMHGCGMMHHGGTMQHCPMGGTAAYTEGRLAFLKTYLAITDQQNAAWEAYASALKRNLEGSKGIRDTQMKAVQAKSPTSRLDAYIASLETLAATLKELRPAFTALYASLSDEQKQKADDLLLDTGCMP